MYGEGGSSFITLHVIEADLLLNVSFANSGSLASLPQMRGPEFRSLASVQKAGHWSAPKVLAPGSGEMGKP